MFGWLKRLFHDKDYREIFSYEYNGQTRRVDPFAIDRALDAALPKWRSILSFLSIPELPPEAPPMPPDLLKIAQKQQEDAGTQLLKMARDVFKLEPLAFDGTGMTDPEALNVLGEFINYCSVIVEENSPLLPSPGHAAQSPASSITAPDVPSTSDVTPLPTNKPELSAMA